MNNFNKKLVSCSLIACLLVISSCNQKSGGSSSIVSPLPDNTVIAEYEGGKILAKDVAKTVNPRINSLNEQVITFYEQGAQQILVEKLLTAEAAKQGLPNSQALMQKMAADVTVTDADIKAFKAKNAAQLNNFKDPKTNKVRKVSDAEVKTYLAGTKQKESGQDFLRGLLGKAKLVMKIKNKPTEIPMDDSPYKGGSNAKVVVQEFSDFECPYCARAKDTVDQIHAEFGDKVKIIFRDYPLSFHKNARPAAIAAQCAHKQGKFWPMHDKIFEVLAAKRTIKDMNYATEAKSMGLNVENFNKCLVDPAIAKSIQDDIDVGNKIGVNSTPTFYVNGVKVKPGTPISQIKNMIKDALVL